MSIKGLCYSTGSFRLPEWARLTRSLGFPSLNTQRRRFPVGEACLIFRIRFAEYTHHKYVLFQGTNSSASSIFGRSSQVSWHVLCTFDALMAHARSGKAQARRHPAGRLFCRRILQSAPSVVASCPLFFSWHRYCSHGYRERPPLALACTGHPVGSPHGPKAPLLLTGLRIDCRDPRTGGPVSLCS